MRSRGTRDPTDFARFGRDARPCASALAGLCNCLSETKLHSDSLYSIHLVGWRSLRPASEYGANIRSLGRGRSIPKLTSSSQPPSWNLAFERRPTCRPHNPTINTGRTPRSPARCNSLVDRLQPCIAAARALPNAEHEISVAPSIWRAKSYVTVLAAMTLSIASTILSAASVQPM